MARVSYRASEPSREQHGQPWAWSTSSCVASVQINGAKLQNARNPSQVCPCAGPRIRAGAAIINNAALSSRRGLAHAKQALEGDSCCSNSHEDDDDDDDGNDDGNDSRAIYIRSRRAASYF